MFRPVSLFIGLRYTRAKRRNHFISFISLISMLGIGLGVMVLITVLSVMNGFDYEIRSRIFDMANQVTVGSVNSSLSNWQDLSRQVNQFPDVKASAPFVNGQGIIAYKGNAMPVMVTGVLPDQEKKVSSITSDMVAGQLDSLTAKSYNIIIGQAIAENLGLSVGDKITIMIFEPIISPLGIFPRYRQFNITGIFHIEGNVAFDRSMSFVNLHDAQALYRFGDAVSGLRLKVSDLYVAAHVANLLQQKLPANYVISDWTQDYGTFFKAIRMEKTMIFFILILIIAVAAFNLVSTLVMVVADKRAEIAILRTLGATPRMIMATFMVQGCIVGFTGTLLGVVGGVTLALNATRIVDFIQRIFHLDLISSSIYFVNYLPSRIEWSDVWQIAMIAFVLSLLATIYPAWQAARTQPAEALRYE